MQITPIKLAVLTPPKDDLFSKIKKSKLRLKNGDVVAVSSKVVSIHEGRCVPVASVDKQVLMRREASLIATAKSRWGSGFTINRGVLIRVAGIDESNAKGHYVLWPKNPMRSAVQIRKFLMREYKVRKLGVIITDSISTPLRRGALGFALAWAGVDPLCDYRGLEDLFGREIRVEQANMGDALAAGAVVTMGEGSEQTPIALIRNAPEKVWRSRHTKRGWGKFIVPLQDDLFAPFLMKVKWKNGRSRT